jgi:K+-sensing histidine kinase KdpD
MINRFYRYRYVIAVLSVLAAYVIKLFLADVFAIASPFIFFFTAVVLSAWIGGLRAGMLATVLYVVAYYL